MSDKRERLLELANAAFPDLTDPERRVVEAAARGDRADFQSSDPQEDDPAKAESWGDDRKVRASVLRWLCVDPAVRRLVDPQGIQVRGALIEGDLNLDFARIPFPFGLFSSAIPKGISLLHAQTASISLVGTHTGPISADGLTVNGDVNLRNGFHARGEVRLLGARIRGNLSCTGGTFEGAETETPEGKTIVALSADGVEVGGDVFLRQGFHAKGEVRLLGARIRGNLDCTGGTFKNPGGKALNADGAEVGGDVSLSEGFHATGEVRLHGARIRGTLACTGGTFENQQGDALNADGLDVDGDVSLRKGFHATGEVRLLGARIRGNLNCIDGTFENPKGDALNADNLDIGGALFLGEGFRATGKVRLIHAKARVLADDEASWPDHGDLDLEGFVYESIHGPTDAKSRLRWLARQYPKNRERGHYHPQPYEQLAAVLRRAGHVAESKKVLMAKEKDLRKFGDLGLGARVWNWILGTTIGYGYRVRRTLYCAAAVIGFGILVFWLAHRAGLLSPTFPSPAEAAAAGEKRLDEAFCPWMYSLDTFLPIVDLYVDLYQEGRWLPNRGGGDVATLFWPDRRVGITWGDLVCTWFWIEIGAGWLLTTLALAGLTGLIRRD